MSWLSSIHLVLSAALFILVFIEGDDEPFWLRMLTAAFVALFWLPLLILCFAFVAADWVGDKIKALRK